MKCRVCAELFLFYFTNLQWLNGGSMDSPDWGGEDKMMIPPPTMLGKIQSAVGGSSISDVLPDGTISSMPWRKAGVRYTQNEIYFDVEEEINAIVDNTGSMVSVSADALCAVRPAHLHVTLCCSGIMRGKRQNQVQLSSLWRSRPQPYFCGPQRH